MLREVSRHFGSSLRKHFDLGTFLVPFPERDSEAGFWSPFLILSEGCGSEIKTLSFLEQNVMP
ncbi:hypothetical protein E2C01_058963 [Portunus trituberculatus]|uniref:Uncharacterized protein n=1 Tax=Portunus trituberculatus TaxID=210409 RepID=A0A5B7GWX6_PORTR|nr:hypothetical protein [Portunus trituberculatus]